MTEPKKKAANGMGSIIENQGGFQYWYKDPITGKAKAKMLKIVENGKKRNPINLTEAKEARDKFLSELADLNAIKTTEQAQLALATTRSLLKAQLFRIDDLWKIYEGKASRPDSGEARLRTIKMVCDRFIDYCKKNGIETADGINTDTIARFVREATASLTNRSYNSYLQAMKQILNYTYKEIGLQDNPANELTSKAVLTESRSDFTPEQIKSIFEGFDKGFFHKVTYKVSMGQKEVEVEQEYKPEFRDEIRLAMLLGLYTGARLKDAVLMRWSNVDIDNETIAYTPHKTEKSGIRVSLPIGQKLKTALVQAQEWKEDDSPYIMPNLAERYLRNPTGVSDTFTKIIEYAIGVSATSTGSEHKRGRNSNRYGMHSFRHSFVTICAEAGVSLDIVQTIIGHGNPAMTEHYLHASMQAKGKAINAIEEAAPRAIEAISIEPMEEERRFVLEVLKTAPIEVVQATLDLLKKLDRKS